MKHHKKASVSDAEIAKKQRLRIRKLEKALKLAKSKAAHQKALCDTEVRKNVWRKENLARQKILYEKEIAELKAMLEPKIDQPTFDALADGLSAESDSMVVTNKNRVYDKDQAINAAVLVHMNDTIRNPKKLHIMTLCGPEQFDYMCHKCLKWMKENSQHRPFWDDDCKKSDPGTKPISYVRHLVFVALTYRKLGLPEDALGVLYSISQDNVSKYLDIANEMLLDILPTAKDAFKISIAR